MKFRSWIQWLSESTPEPCTHLGTNSFLSQRKLHPTTSFGPIAPPGASQPPPSSPRYRAQTPRSPPSLPPPPLSSRRPAPSRAALPATLSSTSSGPRSNPAAAARGPPPAYRARRARHASERSRG